MKEQKVRVGIVGIGFAQQVLVPAFRSVRDCEVAAICASRLDKATAVATRLDIPRAYGNWQEVVADESIDAIAIATPPSQQPAVALAALRHGKSVFCEKPLATTVESANEMTVAAHGAMVANMVDFEFPEIEIWQQAKALLASGGIGQLRHIAVTWNVETYANRQNLQSWKTNSDEGGGALNSLVSHSFHYLEWFAGRIRRIAVQLLRAPGDTRPGDTLVTGCLEMESGVPVSLVVCSHAFLGNGHRVEFFGQDGTFALDNPTNDYVSGFRLLCGTRASESMKVLRISPSGSESDDGRIGAVACLAERFVRWVRTGMKSNPDWEDGLRVQTLLEMARRSHLAGGCFVQT